MVITQCCVCILIDAVCTGILWANLVLTNVYEPTTAVKNLKILLQQSFTGYTALLTELQHLDYEEDTKSSLQ